MRKKKHTRLYIDYIHSHAWRMKRAVILNETSKCEQCGSVKCLQLHHKHYNTLCNETAEDFVILCKNCHKKTHKPKKVKRKRFYPLNKKPKVKFSVDRYHTNEHLRPYNMSKRKVDYTNSYYKI